MKSMFLPCTKILFKKGVTVHQLPIALKILGLTKGSLSDYFIFTPSVLYHYLGKKFTLADVIHSINMLEGAKVLVSVASDVYMCKKEVVNSFEYYTPIAQWEYELLMEKDKHQLLLFYVRVLASLDYKTGIGYMANNYFVEEYGYSRNTVSRYFKALEELKLIYVGHRGVNSNTGNYQTHLYCRYENRSLISSGNANFHRSVSARYNHFLDNPDSFSQEDIKQLYEDCLIYNSESKSKKQVDKIKQMLYTEV